MCPYLLENHFFGIMFGHFPKKWHFPKNFLPFLISYLLKLEHDMKTLSASNHRWMMLSSVLFVAMVLSIFVLGYYIAILMKFRNEMILIQQQQEQQIIGNNQVKFIPI